MSVMVEGSEGEGREKGVYKVREENRVCTRISYSLLV